jgi:hypothetical protein
MRFHELRRTLQRIALAGLPALALGACDTSNGADADAGPDTAQHVKTRMVQQPASPAMQQLINACASGDPAACDSLCRSILCDDGSGVPVNTIVSCELHREGPIATITVVYEGDENCAVAGRRPAGLQRAGVAAASATGAWLARAAQLETASVHAFVALARELAHHGAPRRLWRAALLAARDEIGHASLATALAHRYGARPSPVEVPELPVRSLETIAIENAVEGCVRETWGALLAIHQASAARDPEVRSAMARIADDELRHAALGWAVDRWIQPRLSAAARARVEAARREAALALACEVEAAPEAELVDRLGLPDAVRSRRLLAETSAALWAC